MHRMDEVGLTGVVERLETAAGSSTQLEHFREIVINILHEHAKSFEDEIRSIKVREARYDAIETVLVEMLGVDSEDQIPKAVAILQATIERLENQ